jgi:DegV family protein with EDD domain
MQIVTDSACDLSADQLKEIEITTAPLKIELDGVTYSSEEGMTAAKFYDLLSKTESFPTTSQPSAGDFAQIYRRLAKTDPEILSIHVSGGLSGTMASAIAGAQMVPEAHVTHFDSKILSAPLGWQVQAAARAVKLGWPLPRIMKMLENAREEVNGMYTLPVLKYLIHGGRISHIKGLVASLLNIKPIITVDKETGKYISLAQEVTFKRAILKLVDLVTKKYPAGSRIRVQPLHGLNPEGLEIMIGRLKETFDCQFEAITNIAPVLGAHVGAGMVGLAYGPLDLLEGF